MDNWIDYHFNDVNKQFIIENNKAFFHYPCNKSSECSQISIFLKKGKYKFELWGARGGYSRNVNTENLREESSGRGAYVSGNLELKSSTHFFLFIGGKGEDQTSMEEKPPCLGGFNGGGKGGVDTNDMIINSPESAAGGGGATDIRLINDTSIIALKSRIIVAAGGGGGVSTNGSLADGTPGGTTKGFDNGNHVFSGTQNSGYFGKGQDGYSFNETLNKQYGGSIGGCGGGYYGGYLDTRDSFLTDNIELGGAGGSSFVSGCNECNAVKYDSTNEIFHSNQSIHYSGLKFKEIIMKSGIEEMPIPFDEKRNVDYNNQGNGAIIITFLGEIQQTTCNSKRSINSSIYLFVIIAHF